MCPGERITGSAVIVTVPLGVLKGGDIKFRPALPDWKLTAIDQLGNGNLNKVCWSCLPLSYL